MIAPVPAVRAALRRPPFLAAVAAVLACAAIRGWAIAGPLAVLDADEAVTGLMAAGIARGEHLAFFAGQRYMGSLEQYLQAPLAALAPGNAVALRLPQVALAACSCWLVFAVGRRMLDDRRAAAAAWLYALGPAFNVVYGAKSRGAYGAAVVVGLLGLLLALRHRPGRDEIRTAAAFGFCCGLAGWLSALAAFLLLPALAWLAGAGWRRRSAAAAAALAAGVVGAAPLLLDWARHGLPSVGAPPPEAVGVAERARGLVHPVLPEFLGLAWRVGEPVVPAIAAAAAVLVLAAAWIGGTWHRRRGLLALIMLRPAGRAPADLLLLAVPVGIGLYLASPYTWYTAEPRYLFAMYPVLALGVAAVLPLHRRPGVRLAVAFGALGFGLTIGTLDSRAPADLRPNLARLADVLNDTGHRAVYTDYSLAFPLDYYSGDRVVAVPYGDNAARFPDLARAAAAARPIAYAALDRNASTLEAMLAGRGLSGRRTRLGGITVYLDVAPRRR